MIRVLHYVGKMDRGGMETFIMNLYRCVDKKIQFDFAVHGNENGDFEEEILSMGGKFYNFPYMRTNPLAYKKAWKAFWQEHKNDYDVFHFHTNSLANIIAISEAAKVGVRKRIIHSHSSFANKGRLQSLNNCLHKLHQKKIDKYANVLFACSDKAADWLFGGMECNGLEVKLIKNAINVQKYHMDESVREKTRKELGFEASHKVIGHIGTFLPVKNHEFLIELIERAYQLDNSVRAVLIGNGCLFNEMKEKVKNKSLENIIIFTGVRTDIDKLLMAMDLFVMPSKYEGLPVSLVEAQANGVPLLVSDTITRDVEFNPNMVYCDLSMGYEYWATQALNILYSIPRYSLQDKVKTAGFDIEETAGIYSDIIGG